MTEKRLYFHKRDYRGKPDTFFYVYAGNRFGRLYSRGNDRGGLRLYTCGRLCDFQDISQIKGGWIYVTDRAGKRIECKSAKINRDCGDDSRPLEIGRAHV